MSKRYFTRLHTGTVNGTLCPPGHYCLLGRAPVKCPVHRYRDTPGGKNLSDCHPCPAGYWCNVTGMVNFNNSECPVGHFCTEAQPPALCLPGTRRVHPGAKRREDCGPCPGGFYCPSSCSNSTVNVGGIPCRQRYFCRNGSSLESLCPAGFYCTSRTVEPYNCTGTWFRAIQALCLHHLQSPFVRIIMDFDPLFKATCVKKIHLQNMP